MRVIAHVDMDAFYTQGIRNCVLAIHPCATAAAAAGAATSHILHSEHGSMQPQAASAMTSCCC
jgi:hypothetical protein